MSNADTVRRGWEAAMRGDLEVIAELLAPDVKWHAGDPDAEYACRNRGEALDFMDQRLFGRSDPPELLDVIDAGHRVVLITRRRSPEGGSELVANLTTF